MADINLQQHFSVTFPAALAANAASAAKFRAKLQLVITGPTGGSWVVDAKAKPPTCVAGTAPDADATLTFTPEDMQTILGAENPIIAFTQAFFSGKATIAGNADRALTFGPLLILE